MEEAGGRSSRREEEGAKSWSRNEWVTAKKEFPDSIIWDDKGPNPERPLQCAVKTKVKLLYRNEFMNEQLVEKEGTVLKKAFTTNSNSKQQEDGGSGPKCWRV